MDTWLLFAKVLDYPTDETCSYAEELAAKLPKLCPESGEVFHAFDSACREMPVGRLQELYSSTFDLRPDCTTNLGYHLFGDDIRRNLFMAELKERMQAGGIELGVELPDHMSLVLQLLAVENAAEAQPLMADCLIPCITKMLKTFDPNGTDNVYATALRALLLLLQKEQKEEVAVVDTY